MFDHWVPGAASTVPAFLLLGLAACDLDSTAPPVEATPSAPYRVAGLVEVRFEGVATPDMSGSALVAGSVAELEALRAEQDRARRGGDPFLKNLTAPGFVDGSPGDATIQLDPGPARSFTFDGDRYIQSTYRVRNARQDGTGFDTPRQNLTFVPVRTARTIGETPVRVLERADGSAADPALALQLLPTGMVEVDGDSGELVATFPDVLQVFEEDEISDVDLRNATDIFPYGFMVRTASGMDRTLGPSPQSVEFDGVINFAYRIPLQPDPAADPTTISIVFLALDDSDTRLTQSLEEQTPASSRTRSRERGDALNVSEFTVLPGGTVSTHGGFRTVCSVRTAGTAAMPGAQLVRVLSEFRAMGPDPYAMDGSGQFIPRTASFAVTFEQPVDDANPATFTVRGLQSGRAFRREVYAGNGTPTITTPDGAFLPGEEVEFTVTTALSCPQPQVGRLRVAPDIGVVTFRSAVTSATGALPSGLAVGYLNDDAILDLVTANSGENTVSILIGNGAGTFASQTVSVRSARSNVAVADLNGDDLTDIVTTGRDGTVEVLLGSGGGSFQRLEHFTEGPVEGLALADMNGDAIIDIVGSSEAANHVSVLLGNGDGTFHGASFSAANPFGIAVGDLDGDGKLDVVASDFLFVGRVQVLLSSGDGTLGAAQAFPAGRRPTAVAVGDLDRDGLPDIAAANFFTPGTVSVLLNRSGTFQMQSVPTVVTALRDVAIADLDKDGDLDLVAGADNGVAVLSNEGSGVFEERLTLATSHARAVEIADLNGDGILDVAVANEQFSGMVSVFLGQATGQQRFAGGRGPAR